MALLDDLVAYWKLDEASGTRVDSHGPHDLADVNSVGSATGKVGTAADFEAGNAHRLTASDHADLSSGSGDLYIALWVNFETVTTCSFVYKGGANDLEYDLGCDSVRPRFRVSSGAGFANFASVAATSSMPTTGTWYFVEAGIRTSTSEIFVCVDRGTEHTASYSAGSYDSAGILYLGGNPFLEWHDGLLDEAYLRIGSIPTGTERDALYNGGTGVTYEDFAGGGGDTFTAAATLSAGGATLSATASHTVPTYEAAATLAAAGASLSATGTHTAPVYSADAALSAGGASLSAAATFSAPGSFTATAGLTAGGASLAASASHTAPTYEADATLSAGGATLAASATHSAPGTFTAAGTLSAGGASLSATAAHSPPVYEASAALSAGGATLAASAVFTDPSPGPTGPTVTPAIGSTGNALTLTFSESVTGVRLSDFTLKRDGVPVRSWQLSGSGATWSIRPRRQYDGDGLYTLTYTGTSVVNGSAEAMQTFADASVTNASTLSFAQADYAGGGLTAFFVWNMSTFHDLEWAAGTEDPDSFDPTDLDIDQWLDAVAAAGATRAILTLKHHDGFALWDSATQPHNVTASTWYANGGYDIGVAFYEKCRARGVEPVAYLSVWDKRWELDHPGFTGAEYTAFVVDQIEELKAIGYRKFWTDGWGWNADTSFSGSGTTGYVVVDYDTVRTAVYAGGDPESLLIENSHEHDLTHTDIDVYEVGVPSEHEIDPANTLPAELAESIASTGWFWKSTGTTLKSISTLHRTREVLANSRRGVYSLAVLPDSTGVVPADQVALLAELGGLGAAQAGDLSAGLARHYPLDDVTEANGGVSLTNATGVTFGPGQVGDGAEFAAASTQELTAPDAADLRLASASPKCFAVRYKRASVQSYAVLLSKYTEAAGERDYCLDIFAEEVRWLADSVGGTHNVPAAPVGEWDCVFAWYDPDAFGGKVMHQRGDGPVVRDVNSGGVQASASPFRLGHRGDASFPGWFDGMLDDVAIFDRVPTPAERRAYLTRTATPLTDATAPATPTGFLADLDGTAATLTWDANSESDLAGYRLYHSTDGDSWSVIRDLAAVDDHRYGLALSELPEGDHVYRLTAYDWSGNESDPTAASPEPFTAGTLSEVDHDHDSVTLSWTAATNGTGTVTDQLYRSSDYDPEAPGDATWVAVSGATASPATASGLSPETPYAFRVAYTDDSATVYSDVVTVTTDEAPEIAADDSEVWRAPKRPRHWTAPPRSRVWQIRD